MLHKQKFLVIFLCVLTLVCNDKILAGTYPKNIVVSVPVADILYNPNKQNTHITYPKLSKDVYHKTQVLYGERLIALKEKKSWLYVQIPDQKIFHTAHGWSPCEGWIKKKQTQHIKHSPNNNQDYNLNYNVVVKKAWAHIFKPAQDPHKIILTVSLGTQLYAQQSLLNSAYVSVRLVNGKEGLLKKSDIYAFAQRQKYKQKYKNDSQKDYTEKLRQEVLARAQEFLDNPYCFGGRVAYDQNSHKQLTSVDCSGLVQLAYRAIGIDIPRSSHTQYLMSHRITPDKLQAGDLLFYASAKEPSRMTHVMIYMGNGNLIEATGEDVKKTRIISVEKRIGKPLENITQGETIGSKVYYFGSIFEQAQKVPEILTQEAQDHDSLENILAPASPDDLQDFREEDPEDIKDTEIQSFTTTPKTVRQKITTSAQKFIQNPYRKKHEYNALVKKKRQKIDCSELIQKSYKQHNIAIPRTAHGQFKICKKFKQNIIKNLNPADLIFAASRKNPKKINHVMMYLGNDQLVESTGANGKVRVISLQRRIGTSINNFKYGHKNRNSIYYAGTLF